jgi:hypothetical protein
MKSIRLCVAILACAALSGLASGAPSGIGESSGDRETLRAFEAALDGADSATMVLQRWCADRHLADPSVIRAERVLGADKPADAEVRRRLEAAPDEPIRFRHVRLACGTHVLSEADNWYRPNRLTDEMNRRLDETDTPFGVVVRPLDFHRVTLAVEWPAAGRDGVLRHRAVLVDHVGEPFSLVVETYTTEVLTGGAAR